MKLFLIGKYPEKKDTEEYTKLWIKTLKQNQQDFFYQKIFFKEEPLLSTLKIPYFIFLVFVKKPNIIHAQYFADVCGPLFPILLLFVRLFSKAKIILTVHEKPDFLLLALPKILRPVYLIYEKACLNLAHHIITHTDDAKIGLIKKYNLTENKITSIFYPWYEPINSKKNKIDLKTEYHIKQKFIFIIFGRVVPKKGADLILPIINDLKKKHDIGLIIAGPAQKKYQKYNQNLKQTIQELELEKNIYFFDYLKTVEVSEIMAITDICLFPYRSVTQSGVFFTALGHNVPAIAFSHHGFKEFMDKNNIGISVPINNIEKFSIAMEDLINNPEKIKQFKKNIAGLKDQNSWKKLVEIYDKIYQTI